MQVMGGASLHVEALRLGGGRRPGELVVPPEAGGVVLFAHGSGSNRLSPRNRQVAERLHAEGLATLLFDLLEEAEARELALVFDIPLLGRRVVEAIDALKTTPAVADWPLGIFGASTGAGAALWAAAECPGDVAAVVSRGGRPDLAGARLAEVRAPTLLIVGSRDREVLRVNRLALAALHAPARLEIVAGPTPLLAEPGPLERAADLAALWLAQHLRGRAGEPA
ncbi:MAG: hypothetical protein AMXMBFR66_08050 [Pseudomonadota bacterium]